MTNLVTGRGRFQGVRQILRYNRPFYVSTVAGITAAFLAASRVPWTWRALLLSAAVAAAYWFCTSLLVSHYVYDRFPLYDLRWLARRLLRPPRRWVNIHAGLDETSHLLAALFPDAQAESLDIYDPGEMTEPSIERARRSTAATRAAPANWRNLPLTGAAFDAVFLMFAAHELRRHQARAQLFREAARVLKVGGELVVVEHLRDWANFLAFGPGFLHFLPERAWLAAADAAGLQVRSRISMTPFVCVFFLRRAA